MPRHKGKVERGVAYVQGNGLKGHRFDSLEAENRHLAHWERTIADTRIHGTTRRQVGQMFDEVERPALRPLPRERFPFFQEAQRIVSRDGHVEVAKAYYSVPPEYLTRTVWVRWDARLVRIFNHRREQIAIHVRHEQGRFSTHGEHIAREKINGIERGAAYLLSKVSIIGLHTRQWAEAMVGARGIEGTRVLLGLLSLTKKHPSESLEKACEIALSHGAFRLRAIRQLLNRPRVQAGTAAVPGRASDHSAVGRLRPGRGGGAGEEGSRLRRKVLGGMAQAFNGRRRKDKAPAPGYPEQALGPTTRASERH